MIIIIIYIHMADFIKVWLSRNLGQSIVHFILDVIKILWRKWKVFSPKSLKIKWINLDNSLQISKNYGIKTCVLGYFIKKRLR